MSHCERFTVIGVYEAWSEMEDDLLIAAVVTGTPTLHGWDYVQARPEQLRDE